MIEETIIMVNNKISTITGINLIESNHANTNFFDDILSFKPYQVAMIIYACSSIYNVDLYDKIELDDLCLNKICQKIVSMITRKPYLC